MANLILPSRFNQQPDGVPDIDWAHPSASGLVFLAHPVGNTFFDLVTRTFPDSRTGTILPRIEPNGGGKSSVSAARVLYGDGVASTGFRWPVSRELRGGNIYAAGTLLCLGGSDTQPEPLRIPIGGNTETSSTGNQPALYLDSYAIVGRGNIIRAGYLGNTNSKTSTNSCTVGNPFMDRLSFFGYTFDANGVNGDFFAGRTVEAFTGATAWTDTATNRRAAVIATGGSSPAPSCVAMFAMWNRRMSAAEYLALYDNPWQIFKKRPQILYFDVASGGATETLAGSSATISAGTATAVIEYAASGSQVTTSVGAFTVAIADLITGSQVSVSAGTLAKSIAEARALTGSTATFSVGSITEAISVALASQSVSAIAGTLSSGADTSRSLTGQSVASAIGVITEALAVQLTGQVVASQSGTITGSEGVTKALSGASISALAGVATSNIADSISGQVVTVSSGSVTASVGTTKSLSGQSVASSAGTVSGALTVALVGSSVASQAGFVGAGADVTKAITGSVVATATGTIIKEVACALIGQATTAHAGSVSPRVSIGLVGQPVSATPGSMSLAISKGITGSQAIFYVGILTPVEVLNIVRNVVARNVYVSNTKQAAIGVTRNKQKGATI